MGTIGNNFEASAKVVREPADRSCHSCRTIGTRMGIGQSQRRAIAPFLPSDRAPFLPSDRAHPADRSQIMPIDRPTCRSVAPTAPSDRQTAQFTRASCRSIARHSRSIASRSAFQSRATLCVLFEYLNSLVYFKPTLACKSLFKGGFQPQKDIEFGL